jgi:hypothetical protein
MSVQYTPGQLRGFVGISPETYRHWKKALPPLRRDRGHSPCFSLGDVVAVSVVRSLCTDLGLRVGAISAVADPLFERCNSAPWPVLERSRVVLDIPGQLVELRSDATDVAFGGTIVIVSLWPITEQLRGHLFAADENTGQQQALQFPLSTVPSTATSLGRRRS